MNSASPTPQTPQPQGIFNMSDAENTSQHISYNADDFDVGYSEPRVREKTELQTPKAKLLLFGRIEHAMIPKNKETGAPDNRVSMLVKPMDEDGSSNHAVGLWHSQFFPDGVVLDEIDDEEEREKTRKRKNASFAGWYRLFNALYPDVVPTRPYKNSDGEYIVDGEAVTEQEAAKRKKVSTDATLRLLEAVQKDPGEVLKGETFYFFTRKNNKGYTEISRPSKTVPTRRDGSEMDVEFDPELWVDGE